MEQNYDWLSIMNLMILNDWEEALIWKILAEWELLAQEALKTGVLQPSFNLWRESFEEKESLMEQTRKKYMGELSPIRSRRDEESDTSISTLQKSILWKKAVLIP